MKPVESPQTEEEQKLPFEPSDDDPIGKPDPDPDATEIGIVPPPMKD